MAVSQPLDLDAFEGYLGALKISHLPVVVAEIKFSDVPLQMLFTDVLIPPRTSVHYKTPERFQPIFLLIP